jgi:hypothetical protein
MLRSRRMFSAPLAVALSLVLTGQAAGATWSPRTQVADRYDVVAELVTLGSSTAVVASWDYDESVLEVRRSLDSGATWSEPVLSDFAYPDAALAGRGRYVDVAWLQGPDVFYARSTDGGSSFAAPRLLSSLASASNVEVARGAHGVVAVLWQEESADGCCRVRVRVSRDFGVSFGAPKTLSGPVDPGANVAVGDGVVYASFPDQGVGLLLRRSVDGGSSWSAADRMTSSGRSPTFAALGSEVYFVYEGDDGIRLRHSVNGGYTWSSSRTVTQGLFPVISLGDGVLRLAYRQNGNVKYRQTTNALAWSAGETVASDGVPLGVGLAVRAIVLYGAPSYLIQHIYVKTRQ